MREHNGVKPLAANFSFSAFVLAGVGWELLEAQLIAVGAGVRMHMMASLLGGYIFAIALRRLRRWWAPSTQNGGSVLASGRQSFRMNDVPACFGLVGIGVALGLAARSGSLTLFVIAAAGVGFLPWTRINFCREHCYSSCAMVGAVAIATLSGGKGSQNPIHYILCAWVVWSVALSELLATCTKDQPKPAHAHAMPEGECQSAALEGVRQNRCARRQ